MITSSAWETVDPEGQLRRADYSFGTGGLATTTAVDLGDGQLALLSPPGGREGEALLDALEGVGEVVALVAPNAYHRLGLPLAAARFPEAALFAPAQALPRIQKGLPADRVARPLGELAPRLPAHLEIFTPPHMKSEDTILRFHSAAGPVWLLHDLILNIQQQSSVALERWLLSALGYEKGLRVNRFGCRWVLLRDRAAFAAWLQAELERLPPVIFVPGHGPVIRDPALLATMPALAASIAPGR